MNEVRRVLSSEDVASLQWAHRHLEHPSLAARISNVVGSPVEQGMQLLPKEWYDRLHAGLEAVIQKWLARAIQSMEHIPPNRAHDALHKLLATTTGAVSGFFGPLTLLAELPVTTGLMLRSIADIAHEQGEDLGTREARIACMQVFALGGRTGGDKAAETGYYGLRLTLGFHFATGLLHTAKAVPVQNLPGGIELVRAIATRFGVVVSDSAAAKMIPVVGALSGGLINLLFMQHFQDVARGHFIVRRLEREYGMEAVRAVYDSFSEQEKRAEAFSPVDGW